MLLPIHPRTKGTHTSKVSMTETVKNAHPTKTFLWVAGILFLLFLGSLIAAILYQQSYHKDSTAENAGQKHTASIILAAFSIVFFFFSFYLMLHHLAGKHKKVFWTCLLLATLILALGILGYVFNNKK